MPVLWHKPFKKVQILDQIVHTLPGIRSLATEVISRPTGKGPVYIRGDSICCENYTTEIIYKLNTAR